MLKPTPATAFGLRPFSGLRISDFSCPPRHSPPAQGARQRRHYGVSTVLLRGCSLLVLYWFSIGPLLFLYCSSTDGGFLPPTRSQRPGRRRCPGTSPTGSPTRSPA